MSKVVRVPCTQLSAMQGCQGPLYRAKDMSHAFCYATSFKFARSLLCLWSEGATFSHTLQVSDLWLACGEAARLFQWQ